jgi:condensin complex subunit 3
MTAYDLVTRVHEELDDDQLMITPHQFGLLLIDWTNPQKTTRVYAYLSVR